MKEVRIKVKTVIKLAIVLIIIGGFIYYFGDNVIYRIGKFYDNRGKNDEANAYYNRIVEKYPHSDLATNIEINKIKKTLEKENLGYFNNRVTISADRSSMKSGCNIAYGSLEKINERYNQIVEEHSRDSLLDEYTIAVGIMNWFGGEGKKAISMLESLEILSDYDMEKIRKLNLASLYISSGDIYRGRDILKDDLDKRDKYSYLRKNIFALTSLMLEDYSEFYKYKVSNDLMFSYKKNILSKIEIPYIKPINDIEYTLNNCERYIDKTKDIDKTDNIVEGVVELNGKPFPYTMVYLKNIKNAGGMDTSFIDECGDIFLDFTDKKGRFSIKNIPNGQYGLNVSANWQRVQGKQIDMDSGFDIKVSGNDKYVKKINFFDPVIVSKINYINDDKIEFDWESNREDIVYYTLSIGPVEKMDDGRERAIFTFMSGKIEENSYILNVKEERENAICGAVSYGTGGINPYYILEPIYHEDDYAYRITGYNKAGNIVLDNIGIYSNKPYDKVYIKGKEWTEADKLLLNGNVEKAIEEYEKIIEKDNKDLHSLKALSNLYYYGWSYNENERGLQGKDWDRAEKYLEILDRELNDNYIVKVRLADVYIYKQKYEGALQILNLLAEKYYPYHYSKIGDIYIYMGDYEKAIENHKKYYIETKRASGLSDLMMLYTLKNDLKSLIDAAEKFDTNRYGQEYERVMGEYIDNYDRGGYEEFYALVNQGKIEAAKKFVYNRNDNLAKLYKGIFILQQNKEYNEREQEYTQIYDSITDETLKEIMKYFGKVGINTGFGDF